jgi:hypothetical protein
MDIALRTLPRTLVELAENDAKFIAGKCIELPGTHM